MSKKNQLRFIELVERSMEFRGNIVPVDENLVKKLNRKIDYPVWSSMYIFSDDMVEHLNNLKNAEEKPTVLGFKGKVLANYLWIDIDTKEENTDDVNMNVLSVIKQTKKLVTDIMLNYDLDEKSIRIYFSGSKGFHVGIPTKCFGADNFVSEALPTIFKIMAKEITNNSSCVDFKIYNTTRIFRVPSSKHNKTQYYKVLVSLDTIQKLDTELILRHAKDCIHEETEFNPIVNVKLSQLFDKCCGKSANQFDLLETVESSKNNTKNNKTLFRFPKKGERNDALFRMGVKLFSIPPQYLSNDMVVDIMNLISDAVNTAAVFKGYDQMTEFEQRTFINQAFKYTRLKKTTEHVSAKKVTDYAMQVYDYAFNSKYVSTLVDEFDEDLGGGFVCGNMYPLIGRGGTMKSIVIQNYFYDCAVKKLDSMYFNQEMSINEYFKRQCLIALEIDFIRQVKDGIIKKEDVGNIIREMEEVTGGYCHISNKTDLTPSEIGDTIKRKEDEIGRKIFISGVDSLSGMKMIGSDEVATVVHNTKYLKEEAKKLDTAMLVVAHTRNDCPITTRDTSPYTRAGSKTIDNCDGYMCLSKVIDRENSYFDTSPPDIRYLPGVVYMRFVNKRESGNTIDKVLQVNDSLRLFPLSDEPQSYN